jgi:pimeloyl-ACP methyl ester carboxylesterase
MFKYFVHVLAFTLMMTNSVNAQTSIHDLQGAWLGEMQITDGPKLKIGVEIFKKADGQWGGNIASLDQNQRYIPVSEVKFKVDTLTVQMAGAPVSIQVKIEPGSNKLIGKFNEGSSAFPIELKRVTSLPEIQRPQTPSKTVPYLIKEVSYKNPLDGTWLSATVTSPQDDKKHPAVVLIAGSGPAHRDTYFSGHRPFMVLADTLTRQGFVVLRADKRGVNKSTGDYKSATQDDFAQDIIAAIQFLRLQQQVDVTKINLVGHSEGSLIAAMVGKTEKVNSIISMAGPGMTVLETILLQDQTEPAAKGATEAETDVLLGFSQRFYQIVLNNDNEEQRKQKLQVLYDGLSGDEEKIVNQWNNRRGTLNVDFAARDSFSDMLKGDPVKHWRNISVPVLVLNGTKDSQVPAKENVKGIMVALSLANNNQVDKKIFMDLNHRFQKADTGATTEYAEINESINPKVLNTIGNWLKNKN